MSVVHAFRHSGRAAREDQQREVVGPGSDSRIDRKRRVACPLVDRRRGACAERQDRAGRRARCATSAAFCRRCWIANDQARVDAVEHLLELARHEERIDGRDLRAGAMTAISAMSISIEFGIITITRSPLPIPRRPKLPRETRPPRGRIPRT